MDANLDHLRRKAPAPTAMMTLCAFVVAAALAGCAPAENRGQPTAASLQDPNDAVVAITDPGGPITYRKVRCPANLRTEPEQCLKVEQERLRVRLVQLIIDAAAATHNLELTEEERAEVEKHVVAEKQANADAARVFRGAISGAARVHAGESLDKVAADVAEDGVSIEMLKGAMNEYPTEADARRASARDFIADGDAAVRTYFTRQASLAKLRDLVHQRALAAGITDEAAAEAFWKDIGARHHFRVVDPRYQLPDFKGVLKINEINIETTR
jgi:hypothetical protein